ncbi:transmembrane protein, putative (macronuclear) [Tetrahymena thermophila SB210]|uniref:Transmembrane protein, putative n=1 Tax=Tetrahymena thermophila (strain SB210) TaxID=312017 RepID=I7MGV5_TETTS|nr:transmembrane protein, putative [Tetrahymena thermophila SB210]EAS02081.1 transmembrane protein, putative [Tetrahymena thermophila SB210]|eukprot:XP_001022326.1 transmembrane protein, putative [Tetrahymena thermophila SB210]
MIQKMEKAQAQNQIVMLNPWQRFYRFCMFMLVVIVLIFDIWFLAKTNTTQFYPYFRMVIAFLVLPFGLAFINNNLFHFNEANQETQDLNELFTMVYRMFRVIGMEHIPIYFFTPFMNNSNKALEAKLVEANYYHCIFGSQIVLMCQLHLYFSYMNDNSGYYWIVAPIILHACHLALQGAEIRQSEQKTAIMTFVVTFFHIDFLQNLFEGVGRAILIGVTAMATIYNHFDGDYNTTLTREAFAIDALAAGGCCVLAIFYIAFKTGLISGIFYGANLMFQLLVYRVDSNYMKIYNNFQRRLSVKVTDKQLKFVYYFAIAWRFCELIAIWAAALDNHNNIYHNLDNSSNYLNLRDALLVGLIFDAIYLAVLVLEAGLYFFIKSKFNPVGECNKQAIMTEELQAINNQPNKAAFNAPEHTQPEVVNTHPAINKDKAPINIDEEAMDFNQRGSKIAN